MSENDRYVHIGMVENHAADGKEALRARRAHTRRLLWQWGNTLTRIRRLEQERAAFAEMAADARRTLRSPAMNGMPRGGRASDLSDVVARAMDEAERYERQAERINLEIDDAIRIRNCIEGCIAGLTPLQESILTYRYIDVRSWRFIAMKLNYDEGHLRKIEAQAVDAISEMIEIQTV